MNAAPSSNGIYSSRLLVEKWLDARGVTCRRNREPDGKWRTVYALKECPFDTSHADPDSCIMQAPVLGYSKEIRAENSHTFCITASPPIRPNSAPTWSLAASRLPCTTRAIQGAGVSPTFVAEVKVKRQAPQRSVRWRLLECRRNPFLRLGRQAGAGQRFIER